MQNINSIRISLYTKNDATSFYKNRCLSQPAEYRYLKTPFVGELAVEESDNKGGVGVGRHKS